MTGEIHFVDCGYSTLAMPNLETLKAHEKGGKNGKEPEVEPEKPPREAAQ